MFFVLSLCARGPLATSLAAASTACAEIRHWVHLYPASVHRNVKVNGEFEQKFIIKRVSDCTVIRGK